MVIAMALAVPSAVSAAVGSDANNAPPRQLRILPDDHPSVDPKKRLRDLRGPVVVTVQRHSAQYHYHLYRGIALIVIGLIGLTWIGYRAYGRRHARVST
jgi:hypothetical protein